MPKILIIRFSSIGDIVLTTPVLRALKKQLPDSELHFLTKQAYTTLLSANPYIARIHTLGNNMPHLLSDLKDEQYDHIIDLHHNLRTWRIKRALGVPAKSFNKINYAKWWMVRTKNNRLPDIHIVDRYLKTVEHLGVYNDNDGLDHFIPENTEDPFLDVPTIFHHDYLAVVIGAQHTTKKLPVDKWREFMSLTQKNGTENILPIILIGGPEDKQEGDLIRDGYPNVFNSCGLFSLQQSAILIKSSLAVIAHDTGMMHIAAAFSKKIVSIWGNTIPAFGMFPYFGNKLTLEAQRAAGLIAEVNGLRCRPCSKIGYNKCPKGHFSCMRDQDMTAILKTIIQ